MNEGWGGAMEAFNTMMFLKGVVNPESRGVHGPK